MSYIQTIGESEAQGPLRAVYEGLQQEFGFVPNIFKTSSLNTDILQAQIGLFSTLMASPSNVTRAQREMIALVVSQTNRCRY
ncbi:MAG: carboxymuconolactone decarboxylase family protein [Nitrospinae bacterium]|nr:carboxymuconolactone decarboxylase family protein [Nitrospinota bacterium]